MKCAIYSQGLGVFKLKHDKRGRKETKEIVHVLFLDVTWAMQVVGYTCRHLHQPIEEDKGSTV